MAKRKKTVRRRRSSLRGLAGSAADHAARMKSDFERASRALTAMTEAGKDCSKTFDYYDKARWALSAAEEHRSSGEFSTTQWADRIDSLKHEIENTFFKKCKVIARTKR